MDELSVNQETIEQEIDSNFLDSFLRHDKLQKEILKLESALNMTINHWAEMKSGHSEFANRTLLMLADIINLASQSTTPEPEVDTIDGLDVDEDESVTEDPSTGNENNVQKFYNCTTVKKFTPNVSFLNV